MFFSCSRAFLNITDCYTNIISQNVFCCVTLASEKGYFALQSWSYVRLPLRSLCAFPSRKYAQVFQDSKQ